MMKAIALRFITFFIYSFFSLPLVSNAGIIVEAESAVLHSGPSLANREVTTVYQGNKLTLLSDSSEWLEVKQSNGKQGWIVAEAVIQQDKKSSTKAKTQLSSSTQRLALVIGNANYKNSPLKNPVNDATDMAQVLAGLGFKVTLLLDTSHKESVKQIRNFTQALADSHSVGLFYYAGHGMQVNGRNYLIPVDANIQDEYQISYEGIDVGRVLEGMAKANNPMNIVILDACRDNPFSRSFRSSAKGLAQMDAPGGTMIAYATAPGSVASDGNGRNGLYTKHLLKEISKPNLAIETAMKRVRKSVMEETNNKQIPWESSSLVGEFYFAGSRGLRPKRVDSAEHKVIKGDMYISVDSNNTEPPWYKSWAVWTAAAVITAIIISCSDGGGDGGAAGEGGAGGGC